MKNNNYVNFAIKYIHISIGSPLKNVRRVKIFLLDSI